MTSTTIAFTNYDGINLSGEIHWPSGRPRAFVLFAHCFTCTRKSKAAVTIARALNLSGLAVLTFDFTGLGQSEGEFADSNFSSNVGDLIAAANFLEAEHSGPSILIGHSLGGTAVLAAAERISSCRAVATIGAPARAEHVTQLLGEQLEAIERDGIASVHIGERPFVIKRQFVDDVAGQTVPENLRNLRAALMIMHSPLDRIVEIDNASEIFTNAIHPKSFVSLDKADHLLSRRADAEYAAEVLASWAARYLDPDDTETEESTVAGVSACTGTEGFQTDVRAGRHTWLADEPHSVGGTDLGPTPYDLLGTGLASCTSMTMQLYARRKQWPLEEACVNVEHNRIHAEDSADCESDGGYIDTFTKTIKLIGDLDETQRARLVEISSRCPVHKTLMGTIKLETRLVDD